jgi:serine/threonine-protein kinase
MTEATIFANALEKPLEDRAAYLDEACGGDADLRRRVELLLRSHDQAASFLDRLPTSGWSLLREE